MAIDSRKSVIVPPYWVSLMVGLVGILFAAFVREISDDPSAFTLRQIWTLQGISFFVLIGALVHFSIHPGGIWIRFAWIPIRWISWDKVSSAQYIRKWTTTGNPITKMEGQGIFVTLIGCEIFDPKHHGLNMFTLKHPFQSFFIRFTPRHQKLYVETFQQHFPNITFQSMKETN